MTPRRLGILISGRGSNMATLLEAARFPGYPARAVVVISNRPEAAGLDRARAFGLDAVAVDHKAHSSRAAFEDAMQAELERAGVEFIALAGFMRVLTASFVDRWSGRIINIHPSLLPRHRGVDTHRRALEAGDRVHGCSVHWVTSGVDEGPLIGQAEVDVTPTDSEETLSARVLKAEHLLYPRALAVALGDPDALVAETVDVDGVSIRLRPGGG